MLRRSTRAGIALGAMAACLGFAGAARAQSAFLSEILFNPPSGDNGFEAVEITGTPGMSLDGYVFAVVDGDGTSSGNVTVVVSLTGQSIGSSGVLLIRDAATTLLPAPAAGTNVMVFDFNPDMQNGSQTYVLGTGTFAASGADLDAGNDGAIDAPIPGFTVVDVVAYTDGGASDSQYADDFGTPGANLGDVTTATQAIYRVLTNGNVPFSWAGGGLTGANPGPYNWSVSNFGWSGVGVPDPTQRTLDLGTLNYVFQTTASGACCLPSGACVFTTAQDCATQTGTYQGDNVECGTVNCPQPQGACCFFDGTCAVTTAILCGAQGGTYQGNNTTCNPSPCPQTQGACCLGDGTCQVMGDRDCAAAGGAFNGPDTTCDGIKCIPATPASLYISEIFFNSPGADQGTESIEIVGPPNFNLDGWFFLVIEGDGNSTGGTGALDQKVSLRGLTLGSNGILLIRDDATPLQPAPAPGTNVAIIDFNPDIENNSNTFVLGYGRLDPIMGQDLDSNDDGTIDVPLGPFTPIDAVAYADPSRPPSLEYAAQLGGENLGPVTPLPPGALYRVLSPSFDPLAWVGGFTTGSFPGPYHWSATSNFGFAAVGIADPSTLTLDLGTLNFVYNPPVTGACCVNGSCTILSAADCASQGGTYQGDGIECGKNTCPPACPCDWNSDTFLNSQDFFDFLTAFFTGSADFNHDTFTNSQDFFDFLTCFFTGC
jgi:hypothetical protein